MKYLLLTFCIIAVNSLGLTEFEQFAGFQKEFKKDYNLAEIKIKYKNFLENLKYNELHNEKFAKGLVSYELGVNANSDLSFAEFSGYYTGFVLPNENET